VPEPTRRGFVTRLAAIAGVSGPVLSLIAGETHALPPGEETDLAVLHAAIALEHEAIAIYDVGLERKLFPPGLRDYAIEFRGDHLGHRDTQIALSEERGGRPPEALRSYAFGGLEAGDVMIRKALAIEVAAQKAYSALIAQIRTRDYLLSAGFIPVDEVRHMTVWRRTLGIRIY
jgi:hypothetical protein